MAFLVGPNAYGAPLPEPFQAALQASSEAFNAAHTSSMDPFWGVAPSSALTLTPTTWLPEMSAAGVESVRNFDSTPSTDRLKPILDAGMSATGILWWSGSSPGTLPVNDLGGWRRYVTDMVTRYKGRVHYWEVWNEPPNFTVDSSPASYGAVVAVAYDAAKAADPTVMVGLAAKSNHVNYLAQAIDGGAANKFDFITLHPYENASLLTQGWEGQFMSIVSRVQTMLLDKNPAKANVPVWFTEIGLPVATQSTAGLTPEVQADGLVKIYAMSAAQHVARVYWFSPRDAEGEYLGLTDSRSTKRPAYFALKALTTYLGAHPRSFGWIHPNANYYGFVFDGPKGTVLTAWALPGQTGKLETFGGVDAIDPRTGALRRMAMATITDAPTLFVAPHDSVQAVAWKAAALANTRKAFPWFGDHRSTGTVSLNAATGPDGVYMLNAPVPKIVNGIAEFDVEGRSNIAFTVDPEFLSYTTRPIRITASLRCHGTGDPGFNLKYESNAPLATADGNGLVASAEGWTQIGRSSFYEKSWTILNPRFVGLYGFNFTFDTDGPSHSQFSIQKISVTKLP